MGKKLTNTEFLNRVFQLVSNEYSFLEEYKGRHTKLRCKHNLCSYEWDVEPGAFLGNKNKTGSRCPNCYGNVTKTTDKFKKEIYNLTKDEYKLLSEYTNAKTKVKIKHSKCGNTFSIAPNTFINGSRCPECNPKKPYNTDSARDRISKETNGTFELVSKYEGCYELMKLKHRECGNIVEINMQSIDSNRLNCPYCYNRSRGELLVSSFLLSKNIPFEVQKRFDRFKKYPYDFYIADYNMVIEYHGEQHYKPIKFYGGEDRLVRQKNTDLKKKKFVESKGINYLEIPYTLNNQNKVNEFLINYFK
ncbi:HNH endonuclease [Staphylococcus phage phiRNIID]|nr:HNH endonuclease [Staphylococcus phage phiRNIID]